MKNVVEIVGKSLKDAYHQAVETGSPPTPKEFRRLLDKHADMKKSVPTKKTWVWCGGISPMTFKPPQCDAMSMSYGDQDPNLQVFSGRCPENG